MVGAGMGRKKREAATAQRNASPDVGRPKPDSPSLLNSSTGDQPTRSPESQLDAADIASLLRFFKLLHKLESEKRQQ